MPPVRLIPDGFAQDARVLTSKRLELKYRAGRRVIRRWKEQLGLTNKSARPVPPDFMQQIARLSTPDVAEHYGVNERQIYRWRRKMVIKKRSMVPDDFTVSAPKMTRAQCAEKWGVSLPTVARWAKEAGVTPQPFIPTKTEQGRIYSGVSFPQAKVDIRRDTIMNRAADVLRRNRWAVWPCDDKGVYAEKGTFWRVGNLVLTEDEMLEKASKYERLVA